MTTSGEQSATSKSAAANARPEEFGPPDVTSLASLTDGRPVGGYQSAYAFWAWAQIVAELSYLSLALGVSFVCLVLLAKHVVLKETSGPVFALVGNPPYELRAG